MNAIVISIGGLHVRFLGCYGNTTVETLAIDQFAADGFVFDSVFAPAADAPANWRTLATEYGNLLRQLGVRSVLIRDTHEPGSPHGPEESLFSEVIDVERSLDAAEVFHAAEEWLEKHASATPFLLLLDCYGAQPPWPEGILEQIETNDDGDTIDEPIDETIEDDELFEGELGDEPDDDPVSDLDDDASLEANADAAEQAVRPEANPAASLRTRYAAIVSHFDARLGRFLDVLRANSLCEQSMVCITSDCGAAASAIDRIGCPTSELMHVPLIIRVPGAHDPGVRSSALALATDVVPTVLEVMDQLPDSEAQRSLLSIVRLEKRAAHDYLLITGPSGQRAVRTLEWELVKLAPSEQELDPLPRLYVKPDDRWNVNDLAKQFPAVVEELETKLAGLDRS